MQRRLTNFSPTKKKSSDLHRTPLLSPMAPKSAQKRYSIAFNSTRDADFQVISQLNILFKVHIWKTVVNILKKKPSRRIFDDIEILIMGTESIKFFMDTNSEHGPEIHKECCRYMTYAHLNTNEVLFEQGKKITYFCC